MVSERKKVKILVIRSATRILNQTLLALKREFPDSSLTVLAPEGMEEAVSRDPLVDEVIPVGKVRRMSIFSAGPKTLNHLRSRNFDLAVSLYNVDHGLGYSNIDLLAWATHAGKIRGYNPRGTWVELTGGKVLKKSFLEKTTLVWAGFNLAATGVLFFLITLGLLGEWGIRKLFSPREALLSNPAAPAVEKIGQAPPSREPSKVMTQV
ncbi:MAG: glycosyltransferase family 9 protein [Nitrospinaceae bacterium]